MLVLIILAHLLVAPAIANAARNGAWEGASPRSFTALLLPANGLWYYTAARASSIGPDGEGGWLDVPPQSDLWLIYSTDGGFLSVTDVSITGDRFEVYVDGYLYLRTPAVPFAQQPEIEPDTPGPVPFVRQAAVDSAFADPRYSSGTASVPRGAHLVNVKDISFPPGESGAGFGVRWAAAPTATKSGSWGALKALYR